jgi:hypothetical protein
MWPGSGSVNQSVPLELRSRQACRGNSNAGRRGEVSVK